MPTKVSLAVAGSGKTQMLADLISGLSASATSAAITFTTTGQDELSERVVNSGRPNHETYGWFSFLVNHIIKPYVPAIFPGVHARGLAFVNSSAEIQRSRAGWKYYFDDRHQPYSVRLSLLAKKIINDTGGAPIRRLEGIYSHLFIDEVQDLGGNDLEVLRALMASDIQITATGDVRQAVLTTSSSDRLHGAYRGAKQVDWFREREQAGHCSVTFSETSKRFNSRIASFSDLIHDPSLALPRTESDVPHDTGHDGVFLVDEVVLPLYVAQFHPTILRTKIDRKPLPEAEIVNFGASKGLTRDRVVIITTGPIRQWLSSRTLLAEKTAAGFYVAATRARHSVALVVPDAEALHERLDSTFERSIELWSPTPTSDGLVN